MRVSVLIPAYNAEQYLEVCLDSVCKQSYSDLQIVIVDDGSTDSTIDIIKAAAAKDARIEYSVQSNSGIAATRNTLLEKAKGDAILFVDADDILSTEMITILVEILEHTNADIAMCGVIRFSEPMPVAVCEYNTVTVLWERTQALEEFLLHKKLTGSLWNKLIRIGLLQNIHLRTDVSYGEDALLIWNVLQRISRIAVTSQRLYYYRENPNSISNVRFGEKRLTAYAVWDDISRETDILYPELSVIAHAQFAHQMTMLLFHAARSNYYNHHTLEKIRGTIRKNIIVMLLNSLSDMQKKLFAISCCISFRLTAAVFRVLRS